MRRYPNAPTGRWIFQRAGEEEWGKNPKALVDEFERLLMQAVEERLRADVPVGSYLSGGVDSSMILALACRLKGPAINTYTVRVDEPQFDELSAASLSARHIGAKPPIVQEYGDREALEIYPQLIEAAEAPVIDTACGALLKLAERVHANGQKVVLTGEGADEWLVGYPWYKAAKLIGFLDALPGLKLGDWARSRLPAHEQGAAFSAGMARARGEFHWWTKRLGRFLRFARDFETALLFRGDARCHE